MSDLRYAIRLLRRSRLFTVTVVLTIAIGIGATTAIFSVVNAVLLRPLPFADPDRLMQVAEKNDTLHLPNFGSSALNFLSWKEQTRGVRPARRDSVRHLHAERPRRSRELHRQRDQPVADAAARTVAGGRARLQRGGRQTRGRAGRDDQRIALAAALRRRDVAHRTARDAERRGLHGRRHRAAGAHRADQRRHLGAAGHRSAEGDAPEPRAVRGRTAETGRHLPDGAGGDGHDRGARGAAVSGGEGLGHQPDHLHRHVRQQPAADRAARPARRRRCSSCSSSAPTSRTCCWRARWSGRRRWRCAPRSAPGRATAAAPAPGREPGAVERRRRDRAGRGDVGRRAARIDAAAQPAAGSRHRRRSDRRPVRARR